MKKKFHLLITVPLIFAFGGVVMFQLLPNLFDLYFAPGLLANLPFTEKQLSLSRLSPWKMRGTLTLADHDRPTLLVPKLELHYTPTSLFKRKINSILLDSASFQIEIINGQPVIRGLSAQHSSDSEHASSTPFLLPMAAETIVYRNCSITIHQEKKSPITLIADGHFSLKFQEQLDSKQLLKNLSGQLRTMGALSLSGEFGLEVEENVSRLQLKIQAQDIGQALALFPDQKIQLRGKLLGEGQAEFNQTTHEITSYRATAKLPGFLLEKGNLIFSGDSKEQPVTLELTGNMEKAEYSLANLHTKMPEKFNLNLKGKLDIPKNGFSGIATVFLDRTKSSMTLSYNGNRYQSTTSMHYDLKAEPFTMGDAVSCSPFSAQGDIEVNGGAIVGKVKGRLEQINLKKNHTKLINLSFQQPLLYPVPVAREIPDSSLKGQLQVEKVLYKGVNSGKLKATFAPHRTGIDFNTLLTTPFLPGAELTCEGSALLPADISLGCGLPETEFDSSTFPKFIPIPKKLFVSGRLAADGDFQFHDNIPSGKLSAHFTHGTLTQDEKKLSDINLGIVFPNLPLAVSSPGQLCTISSLDIGKIHLSDAKVLFRIDNPQTIFLEKIRASWCGGKVETGSFTLASDMEELDTTLYCDRIGFTELLAQFGIDKAEGQGSLNGRLPVHISKTGLTFDDGFLFSTPGNSGIVRFTDTKALRQGIPNIGQTGYLDYSMKALENFSYNWTKLSFNSVDDDLLIAMQLDGKPAKPLAYGYRKGQIVPTDEGPGLQHPIRLDVNFRLPLQDLYDFGTNIQSIMEKM